MKVGIKIICIYDFDGTLTKSSLPNYEILKDCGYSLEDFNKYFQEKIKNSDLDMYHAYYASIKEILKYNEVLFNKENISKGSNDVDYNHGIFEYFENTKQYDIKNFVVTSGFADYIRTTQINPYWKMFMERNLRVKMDYIQN